ncbi:MAG TPA: hypothetical protein VK629_00190 [Steroidobacteraceae bacterium]|nr:hypothetical protein [Steroidobacteraceae bacterium]
MRLRPQISILAAVLALSLSTPLFAQEDEHAACAAVGWVPREILERPVVLRPSTGNSNDAVTTTSSEARSYYLQGLNYLHGYTWIEAARSFNQALRLDSKFSMAHWGLSRTYSGLDDHPTAVSEAKLAQQLATTPREKRRAALRLVQLDAIGDMGNAALFSTYKVAIDKALNEDADDVELWLIRGNAEEPTASGRGQRGAVASTAFYHRALQVAPDNAAAHHYLIHSYEGFNRIDRALVHGEAYARLAAAIPHAHHMWGHDLRRVGRIDDAIVAFTKTNDIENSYYKSENIPSELDWHHVHNLDLLATSHEHKGQMKKAEALLREAVAVKAVTEYQEYNQKSLAVFLLGRERWRDALAASKALINAKGAGTRAVGHAFAGHAQLGLRNKDAATRELAAADAEMRSIPSLVGGVAVSRGSVLPYVDVLRGETLLRDGKQDEGRALLKDVQIRLRALPGPDAWTQALFRLEAIARMARDVGDWELAEHTARQMLEHDPAFGGSHLALALVANQRGNTELAKQEANEARKYWRDADAGLKELSELDNRKFADARR